MNQKVRIGSSTVVTLTDRNYKAAGGEASIYVNGPTAFKLYHDPKHKMLPRQKMAELAKIDSTQVVIPREIIFDASSGEPLGYTTTFVPDAYALLKFFTRTFKDENSIDASMITELVKQMQLVVSKVHAASCLIVDLNELNVLVKIENKLEPWFIDTDSYATPSFRATAIMDSVRDRRVSKVSNGHLHYEPDDLSDWFSWGILAFWLYTNIHPFRGNHPKYKPKDKSKQMDDGISVFHKGVRLPPVVNNFNVIPKRHLDWFQAVFLKNERSVPPLPDAIAPQPVPSSFVTIKSTDNLVVEELASYPDPILSLFEFLGILYVATKTGIYAGQKELNRFKPVKKLLLSVTPDGTLVYGQRAGSKVVFSVAATGEVIGSIAGSEMFSRNNAIYTGANGRLVENSFTSYGTKVVHKAAEIENISNYTSTFYEGCVVQDLLGKKYLTLPYAKGRSFSKYIPQLDGFRVVEAKSEKNVTVILAERGGVYHRFIVIFDSRYTSFVVRDVKDVAYDAINFTVRESGLCLLLSSPDELELFVANTTANQTETLSDPPFDATMRLFSTQDGALFINGNSLYKVKRK